jgi:hypothetical protein
MAGENAAGYLLAEEFLSAGDERFVETILTLHDPKRLASLADKWKRDHRPALRAWAEKYLDDAIETYGHEPVVKRLFKQAEENRDDEQMAVFMVAFDQLVRRKIRTRYHYDWNTRSSWNEQYLFSPRDRLLASWRKMNGKLFSYHTRNYLRRRVWRYFRRMGFQSPDKYVAAVARALVRYEDLDFAKGENLLDNWSFVHACFFKSPAFEFTASEVRPRSGALPELSAAPMFPKLWREKPAATVLLDILTQARARAVRVWAMQLIQRDHLQNLSDLAIEKILALLDNADPEVQTLGAQLLEGSRLLPTLPLDAWLRLVQTKSLTALEIISRLMRQHISPDRVSFPQAMELALVAPTPVARLGLDLLRQKTIGPIEVESLTRLADVKCTAIAFDAAKWALSIVGTAQMYNADRASRFFDSLHQPARTAAWEWLVADAPGYRDPQLWGRLLETPFDDLKLNLVKELERRATLPGTDETALARLWTGVLLNIHRGGRAKLAALRQISEALLRQPKDAETLLPVLAVAIRSVRLPEARGGLSAIVRAADERPEIAELIKRFLPELELRPLEVTT